MFLPKLNETKKSRSFQIEFKGLNHNYYVGENEFFDMKNMASTYYPVLSPRDRRKFYSGSYKPITGMTTSQGKLAFVCGTNFYYNGTSYGTVTAGEKQFVTMGSYIVIFPDKKVFSTATLKFEDLGASFQTTDDVHYELTTQDGDKITVETTASEPPEEPKNGDYWMDTSETPNVLKQYSENSSMWVSVPTVYTKIKSSGIGKFFSQYDGVTITGSTLSGFDGNYVIQKVAKDYIVVIYLLEKAHTQEETITITREIPDMDFVCELNNRIWGCSSTKHEIYACKLGDPKNWYSYAGLSTDSYALTVGSDGDFTGCVSHLGYVLFFKENIIHKIYGTKPSNFQLTDTHARGVEKGSEKSLCVVNETLYYKARNGVCCYDGALPIEISQNLGTGSFHDASAGALGDKYYISMKDENNVAQMFVYDESVQMWHREDETEAKYMTTVGGSLYYVDSNGKLVGINGEAPTGFTAADEEKIEWSVETGEILYAYGDRRYLSRLIIRTSLERGSSLSVSIKYDNGEWREVYTVTAEKQKTYLIPIIPRRSDIVHVKLSGVGPCKVFAVGKTIEWGSDI